MFVYELFEGKKYKCTCHPGDPDPDCPEHGLEPMEVGDELDVKNEAKQRLDPKCWKGYRKAGTKMKGGTRVNNCVPIEEENKGLYYNVNKRKKAGISRDKDHPKAPTAQAWKDAAKTAKNESIGSGIGGTGPARPVVKPGSLVKAIGLTGVWRVGDIRNGQADITQEIPNTSKSMYIPVKDLRVWTNKPVVRETDDLNEGGPFSYGAKKPRKGSVADLAAQKRKEQERGKQPAEPKDHMVGVARVKKDVDEGWKGALAGAALAGGMLGGTAQAQEPAQQVKPITVAYVSIDGEMRKYNLGDKFDNAREAEQFISSVLSKQGLQNYQIDIKHGYPKKPVN